jgi:effector-binding domain-containing protein
MLKLIETPQKATFGAVSVARLHIVTPREQIQQSMHGALGEVTDLLKEQGIPVTGPWFAHHHRRPTDTFDFDVCFPIAGTIQPSGRVENGETPATEVLRTVYRGPYDGLPRAWPEFVEWIEANEYKTRGDAYEVYTVGPREESDPANWQTEMNYPLADA